jgi:predicted unusual protein kinase regulating ubiquinone biosynthesis (AarF/ABC1/UbiB family)
MPARRRTVRSIAVRAAALAALVGGAAALAQRRGAADRALPTTGFVARNAQLAAVGARSTASYAVHRARLATASDSERETLETAYQLRTATQVAEVLGNMKGALMKIGQMASYLDDGLPEPVRVALASLQQDAPPMAPGLCADVVRVELGDAPERVFGAWDPVPIAAASIGQVHRATTRAGLPVAVKVQYPGVDQAIRADLVNTDLLFRVLATMFPGLEPGPLVAELRERLTEELDYGIEAANQRFFADAYRGHPFVSVPEVVDELTTARVLTTELAEGARFAEVERWSQEERDLAAETIYRFVFRSIYRLHAFNGDPHPGNYLFRPGGHVTFLDFGLVKRYTADDVALFEQLIRTMLVEHDVAAFRRLMEEHHVLRPDPSVSDDDVAAYFGHFYELVLHDRVFTVEPEYSSETVRMYFDPTSPYAHVARAANVPPAFVITQRINLGLTAVLGRLHATANFRRIAEELWPFVAGPPSTPMGEAEAAWLATRSESVEPA